MGKLLNHLAGIRIVFPDSIVVWIELLPKVLLIECARPKVPVWMLLSVSYASFQFRFMFLISVTFTLWLFGFVQKMNFVLINDRSNFGRLLKNVLCHLAQAKDSPSSCLCPPNAGITGVTQHVWPRLLHFFIYFVELNLSLVHCKQGLSHGGISQASLTFNLRQKSH